MKLDLGNKLVTTLCIGGQTTSAATVNGSSVDRRGYEYGVMLFATGKSVGTPTGTTVTCTVQDSADDTTFAAYGSYSVCITAASVLKRINMDLNGAKRYIRPSMVTVFNGGTNPTANISSVCILDAFRVLPKNDTSQTT